MISQQEIWGILESNLKTDDWTPLEQIYTLIEAQARSVQGEQPLRWKRNVRNVLQRRKSGGEVEWNGRGSYRLARRDRR